MKVCLVGYGNSNKELLKLVLDQGHRVAVSNNAPFNQEVKDYLTSLNVEFEEAHDDLLRNSELALVSPGVPPTSEATKIIRENNIRYSTEIEYCWMHIKTVNPEAVFIGITGTDGKSTTTSLMGHILRFANLDTFVGGNIGVPLATAPANIQYYVIEVSSFQMYWSTAYSPNYSILLNLAPDHQNWHTSLEEYYNCKKEMLNRTLRSNGEAFVNTDVDFEFPGREKNIYRFDSTMMDDDMVIEFEGKKLKINNDFFRLKIYKEDAVACIITALRMGIDFKTIEKSFESFKPLAHRLELAGEKNGVKYYDDSKATNVHSAHGAYLSFRGRHYIGMLSGVPKNEDMSEIIEELKNFSEKVFVFGDMEKEVKKYELNDKFEFVSNLEEAFRKSKEIAKPGCSVVLSPAGASFDFYKNYGERGDHFQRLVKEIGE